MKHYKEYLRQAKKGAHKFLSLRHENPKRFTLLGSGAITFLSIAVGLSFAAIPSKSESFVPPALTVTGTEDAPFQTTYPEPVSNTATALIPGTVISHETANIYPRRDGIVEDIYVDIGDEVKKGQVVALFLPKGVEGQSQTAIAEKTARKAQAETEYLNAISVSEATVTSARQQLLEKETALRIAESEQGGLLSSMRKAKSDISQARDQAAVAARDARQAIERILTGSNSRTGISIKETDIIPKLGMMEFQTRYDVAFALLELERAEAIYNEMNDDEKSESINLFVERAQIALSEIHDLLSATSSAPIPQPGTRTAKDPADMIQEIFSMQDRVLNAEEKYEDAILAYETLAAREPDVAAVVEGRDITNAQSNKVKLLTSQLDISNQHLSLVESEQQRTEERAEKGIDIANAMLSATRAESGNRNIRSPFTGIVSKRFLEVGQIAMPSAPAFELVGVPTSLSKEAKAEIKFGLPEDLQDAISLGDTVHFFLPDDEAAANEAVVTRKSPQVDRETHTITVQAKIADDLLLPHRTSVRVRITDNATPLFRLPSFAVKRPTEGGGNIIWIIDLKTGTPISAPVTVHEEDGEFAEVSGKIDEGTLVILDPPDLFLTNES